jgi:hypothetical protein
MGIKVRLEGTVEATHHQYYLNICIKYAIKMPT